MSETKRPKDVIIEHINTITPDLANSGADTISELLEKAADGKVNVTARFTFQLIGNKIHCSAALRGSIPWTIEVEDSVLEFDDPKQALLIPRDSKSKKEDDE